MNSFKIDFVDARAMETEQLLSLAESLRLELAKCNQQLNAIEARQQAVAARHREEERRGEVDRYKGKALVRLAEGTFERIASSLETHKLSWLRTDLRYGLYVVNTVLKGRGHDVTE